MPSVRLIKNNHLNIHFGWIYGRSRSSLFNTTGNAAYATISKELPPFTNAVSASVRLDPTIDEKKFPGFGRVGQIKMPVVRIQPELDLAVRSLFRESAHKNKAEMEDRGKDIKNKLWSRKIKITDAELQDRAAYLETRAINHLVTKNPAILAPDNSEKLEAKTVRMVKKRLKSFIAKWSPLEFSSEFEAMAYSHAMLAPTYASIYRVLKEIRVRDPQFVPNTVIDFGSGLATSYWVMKDMWKHHTVQEYTGYETSPIMTQMAMRLLETLDRGAADENIFDLTRRGIYFRQQLPGPEVQSGEVDLVICDRTLCELQDPEERRVTVGNLWDKTKDYLVLIEYGTIAGHRLLMEARDSIVSSGSAIDRVGLRRLLAQNGVDIETAANISTLARHIDEHSLDFLQSNLEPRIFRSILPKLPTLWPPGRVFAPCPHEFVCPKLTLDQPCNFLVRYHPLDLSDNTDLAKKEPAVERMSYLIMMKDPDRNSSLINKYLSDGDRVSSLTELKLGRQDSCSKSFFSISASRDLSETVGNPDEPQKDSANLNDTQNEHCDLDKTDCNVNYYGTNSNRPIDLNNWPRLMKDSGLRPKSATCHLCATSGQLQDVIVSTSRHGQLTMKIVKQMKWGDRVPLETDLELVNDEKDGADCGASGSELQVVVESKMQI